MVHQKNLKTLVVKTYKSIHGYSPKFMTDMFLEKNVTYYLRINNLFTLPEASKVTCGLHSFTYRACATWNNVTDDIKSSQSVITLKRDLGKLQIKCSCKLCIKK